MPVKDCIDKNGINLMLKYKDKISKIVNCPFTGSKTINKDSYRFVFDRCGGKSFIPVIVQQPKRAFRNNHEACSSCGLSMYSTESQAKKKYEDLIKRYKNIYKSIGDKLAHVKISTDMGVCSKESNGGHFDFFEYKNCELDKYSTIIGSLL